MFGYLSGIFGLENICKTEVDFSKLPLFMNSYEYESLTIYNKLFILMMQKGDFNVSSFIGHSKIICEMYDCEVVMVLKNSKEVQRQNLIKNNIMFIEKNKYIFIPSIGTVFMATRKDNDSEILLTFKETIVALSLLYIPREHFMVSDIISLTEINKMTISRSLNKLEDYGLVEHNISNNRYLYKLKFSKVDYINSLLKIMKNPIIFKRTINVSKLPDFVSLSGISAISMNSMLSDDTHKTFAISKENYETLKEDTSPFCEGIILNDDEVILEVWEYEPRLFLNKKIAELVSVIKTIDIDDERVSAAIDDVKGRFNERYCEWF